MHGLHVLYDLSPVQVGEFLYPRIRAATRKKRPHNEVLMLKTASQVFDQRS
jgi:hypothetical protein